MLYLPNNNAILKTDLISAIFFENWISKAARIKLSLSMPIRQRVLAVYIYSDSSFLYILHYEKNNRKFIFYRIVFTVIKLSQNVLNPIQIGPFGGSQ